MHYHIYKRMEKLAGLLLFSLLLAGCKNRTTADLLVYNAHIYTVNSHFTTANAMVIVRGRVIATGNKDSLLKKFDFKESFDANGKYIYPGFIDAHAHFINYALQLQKANLYGSKSWEEIVELLKKFDSTGNVQNDWLLGAGWDQNDWPVKEFPDNGMLNQLFPDKPVLLTRVDGHAAIANRKALELAGITAGEKILGGHYEVKNGQLTGMLIDNAIDKVAAVIPPLSNEQKTRLLLQAQQNCFAAGLTTIDDCGLHYSEVELIDSLQKKDVLQMRIYALLSDQKENYEYLVQKGKIKTSHLNVRGFKIMSDGALGSRGACLLHAYSDQPRHYGFLLNTPTHFDSVAALLYNKGYQMCTHAIGDSANRVILNTYAKYLKKQNDLRWRIEHAQVIHPDDFKYFGRYSIIPSVQPTHATSDMYWAEKRLGKERMKGAYAFQQLLRQNQWIPLGTDFPVEDISPLKTFLAAVFRVDAQQWPEGGFQPGNALTREQALRGMTIWAAKSNFEEGEKGSLEPGKWADFIILDQDLLTVPASKVLSINVLNTFIAGRQVYSTTK